MPDPQEFPTVQSLRDVPPETMVPYAAVAHLLFGTTLKGFEEASRKGSVPRGVRMTRKSPMHFRAGDLAAYIAKRLAPLEQAQ